MLCLTHVDAARHTLDLDQPSVIASLIDHTLLKPEASRSDIERICAEAREFSFASVCVNPCWVRLAAEQLSGSQVKVCTVIGFPLGANETRAKFFEAELALSDVASELDMVINLGALRSGDEQLVRDEIEQLAVLAHSRAALLKVILETCLLSDSQKRVVCKMAVQAGADFVKTSTGFAASGATRSDVALLREIVADRAGVKASGGIRSLVVLREMVRAGADRVGTSSGVQIMQEMQSASAATFRPPDPAPTSSGADY